MEGFLLLIIGIPLGIVVAIIVLLARMGDLTRQVRALEGRLERLEGGATSDTAPDTVPKAAPDVAPVAAKAPQPEASAETPATAPAEIPAGFGGYVFNAPNLSRLSGWLRDNWVLAVAALSLILGGLFMVQYGVEQGLLTPPMRVGAALALALALIAGGEVLRRRHGDQSGAARQLPSTLSGAGIVIAFIAVLAAHRLYDMSGAIPTLAVLALMSVAAVLAGWLYGPVLSAIGLLGAGAAPFVIVGGDQGAGPLYPYLALVGLTGLGIDSVKRWAWVSALALIVSGGGLALLWLGAPYYAPGLALAALMLAIGAALIPERSLTPRHGGAPLLSWRRGARPDFPVLLAAAGMGILSAAALALTLGGVNEAEASLGFALALAGALGSVLWLGQARVLAPLSLAPGAVYLAGIAGQALLDRPLYLEFRNGIFAAPETPLPGQVWWLAGGAALMALAGFWRLTGVARAGQDGRGWALGTAAVLPAALLLLELLWQPGEVIGLWLWALLVMAGAALMVGLSERRMRAGGPGARLEAGFLAAAALVLITLGLFVMLTKAALSAALVVMLLLAAGLDRRVPMLPLVWIVQAGAALIGYRMLVDPGLEWGLDASWPDMLLSYGAPLLGYVALRRVAAPDRAALRALAESAALVTGGVFGALLLARLSGLEDAARDWGLGLMAAIWSGSALAQLWRMRRAGRAGWWLRAGLAACSAVVALAALVGLLVVLVFMLSDWGPAVQGPPLLDSLGLALVPLALVLGGGAWVVLRGPARRGLLVLSGGVAGLWLWLEIRRLWRGPNLGAPPAGDGELYSYTLALLAVSLGLLAVAVWRRSGLIRRLAMAGVALTIAKVFLIDMSGLSGLMRVVSFVGLGLALVGLAWLNRVINLHWDRGGEPETDGAD